MVLQPILQKSLGRPRSRSHRQGLVRFQDQLLQRVKLEEPEVVRRKMGSLQDLIVHLSVQAPLRPIQMSQVKLNPFPLVLGPALDH